MKVVVFVLSVALLQVKLIAAPYSDWNHAGSIFLLTTPEGADLPANAMVETFPVLVRLHRDTFDFRQAKAQGDDLRFATPVGVPLAYQIDAWDAERGEAAIWVRVLKIAGNARQEIRVFWGKPDAQSESSGTAVFNESNGYAGVWHLGTEIIDEVGTLPSKDVETTPVAGMIGVARHLAGGQGVFCGEKIENYPSSGSPHSTEAWFRAERPNTTIIGWGNEGGGRGSKVRMQFRSPPHVHIDSDFSDVDAPGRLPMHEWIHVVHTYTEGKGSIYINGELAGSEKPTMNIKSPMRLWLGGWYHNYDFIGDLDEVRISRVARSADWIRLQYENQKSQQTLVGPLVQPGNEFSVSAEQLNVSEGKQALLGAQAGGAQKLYWILTRDGQESVVATDRLTYSFDAGRVTKDQTATLQFQAIYLDGVKTKEIAIKITEEVPEPVFQLKAPVEWDGRQTIEVVPQIDNWDAMKTRGAAELNTVWTVDGLAVVKYPQSGKLTLKRAQNSGIMTVTATIDNGGTPTVVSSTINVTEPPAGRDPWVSRQPDVTEQPEDNQFYARDDQKQGTLHYVGELKVAAESVFVRLFADDQLLQTESSPVGADRKYAVSVELKPGLVKYRTEFGTKTGGRETVLHSAKNLLCGDVYLISGQSNAVATDFGNENSLKPSDWVRTFGATDNSPNGARLNLWASAQARSPGGVAEIGYWGMELGRRLVETQQIPICILNGAVGGTRIDQHQRNSDDPTDANSIYGRLLHRVRQAKLTHGVRGILWHQGENDQGADGPNGGYGWETYRQYFIDLAGAWKEDYPNVQRYYVFQIWPKSCAMGINGSDNKLREVQRSLQNDFSNLSVMSTLGIKPPGGCHFPAEGYAEFARMIAPVIESQIYLRRFDQPVTPPNLKRAYFANAQRNRLVLEFDQAVVWKASLKNQFFLDGDSPEIANGSATGQRITLQLQETSQATRVSYLDGDRWNPDLLLYGENGLAALTFCDIPIARE